MRSEKSTRRPGPITNVALVHGGLVDGTTSEGVPPARRMTAQRAGATVREPGSHAIDASKLTVGDIIEAAALYDRPPALRRRALAATAVKNRNIRPS